MPLPSNGERVDMILALIEFDLAPFAVEAALRG